MVRLLKDGVDEGCEGVGLRLECPSASSLHLIAE